MHPKVAHHTLTFELLAQNIESIQTALLQQAAHAVNLSLTARNWLMGCYIVEFEQNGEDKAQYGAKLLKRLEERLHTKGLTERRFREFRRLYLVYPQLGREVLNYVGAREQNSQFTLPEAIRRTATAESENIIIRRTTSAELEQQAWQVPADKLFYRLPLSHLTAISKIDDPLKRAFYEIETIKDVRRIGSPNLHAILRAQRVVERQSRTFQIGQSSRSKLVAERCAA